MTRPVDPGCWSGGPLWLEGAGWGGIVTAERPAVWLRGLGDALWVGGDGPWLARVQRADPGRGSAWDRLVAIARALRRPTPGDELGPGFAGAFSYELGRRFESLPERLPPLAPALDFDFALGLYEDPRRGGAPAFEPRLAGLAGPEPKPGMPRLQHRDGVERIRSLIAAGTIYQANLTFRFGASAPDPRLPLATWLRLRRDNPSPYGGLLTLPGVTLVTASPECFLQVDPRGLARSEPIKGTRPRMGDPRDDERSKRELVASSKDRAELSMIVDLVRNDLGRVCQPGTVSRRVPLEVHGHPTVWHLSGDVQGRLAPGRDVWDLLRAAMPPGSCIGAPKIQAMKELDALERSRRGPYTGAIGWVGLDGRARLSVGIRTLAFGGGRVEYGVGGGIVFDSRAEQEWDEAWLKGRALRAALTGERFALPGSPERSIEPWQDPLIP